MVALLVVMTILVFLTVDYLVQRRHAHGVVEEKSPASPGFYGRAGYRVPQGVFFDAGHTWSHFESSGDARVGVNDFVQSLFGEISDWVTRPVGATVRKGETLLELRHGDRNLTINAPFDGVIRDVNADVLGREELLSMEPHSASWVYRIQPTDTASATEGLMIGAVAKEWLKREVGRLKVFLSTITHDSPTLGLTMQDGGLPAYGLVDYLDEDEWSTLCRKFFAHDRN